MRKILSTSYFAVKGDTEEYNPYRIANLYPKNNKKKNRGKRTRKKCQRTDENNLKVFIELLQQAEINEPHKIESIISSRSRKFLNHLANSPLFQNLDKRTRFIMIKRSQYFNKARPYSKDKPLDCILNFSHKIIEDINFNNIFNSGELKQLIPKEIKLKKKPQLIFKYTKNIGSKILNYNNVLKNTGIINYDDILNMRCDCANSPFKHDTFGHIITGNLDIVKEKELRLLMGHGTKFREIPILRLSEIKNDIKTNLESFCNVWLKHFKVRKKDKLKKWKDKALTFIYNRLDYLSKIKKYPNPVLSINKNKKELDRLRDIYIITVVDKAANNFAFTCKKFYLLKLAVELGLNNPEPGNETYHLTNESESDICKRLTIELTKYDLKPDDKEMKLAILYQTPKFHKNPPKMRYIAGNTATILTTLDKTIAKVLKMLKSHFERYCVRIEEFTGIKHYIDIDTSDKAKKMFDSLEGKAETITINDFSTLYTLFDHRHLLDNVRWLLTKLSKNSNCMYITIYHGYAKWTSKPADKQPSYTITEILEMITLLITNTYIKALGHIFQQIKGMIMGGSSSGFLSDLSLSVDEFKHIDGLMKTDRKTEARKFKHTVRYRDDITSCNHANFPNITNQIYPPSLALTTENDNDHEATVLDMDVKITQRNFITKVYCKTDDFPFHVISLPFLESNISCKLCYLVFYGQVLRYQRLCTLREDFENRTHKLSAQLISRGYNPLNLKKQFSKVIGNYREEFNRFEIPRDIGAWFGNILLNDTGRTIPKTID